MEPDVTRREALRLTAGSLLAAGLWPGALHAEGGGGGEEFTFLVVNDLHYRDEQCGAWFERVVRQMKARSEKLDFCLLVGDLAEHGRPAELAPVRDQFKGLGIPVHVVIGNHDYAAQDDRKPYEDAFPNQVNYQFEHRGWQFLGLDTTEGQHYHETTIPTATLKWVEETLPRLDKKRPMVVFTHFPLGPEVKYRPKNADDLLGRFKDYNLRTVFNGHWHGFTERRVGEIVLTTNRCCAHSVGNFDGTKEKGYFVCYAKDGTITRQFVEVKPA